MLASLAATFRQRLLAKEVLVGTFVKTPSPIITEVLALTALDAVCLDAEHAPFGRVELDACIQTLRAAGMPALVRVAANAPEYIMQALDCGATGIIVPHITTAEQAEAVARAAHFGEGGRGYAGSTRAAGYTQKPLRDHVKDSAQQTAVIVQIEDPSAVTAIEEICTVTGVDCLFIGRIDLTVALQAHSPNDEVVIAAVEAICTAATAANKTIGMFVSDPNEAQLWQAQGASLFLLGSDHGFILSGANNLHRLIAG